MENQDANAKLIPFLRNLADSIEEKKLLPQQLQRIGEFFMAYQFQEQAIRDGTPPDPRDSPQEFSSQELFKFIVLGWFIYCVLLKNERVPEQEDVDY